MTDHNRHFASNMRRRLDKDQEGSLDDFTLNSSEATPFLVGMSAESGISFEDVMALEPVKVGYGLKRDNSWASFILPCLFPRWKRRCFVLIGSFLLRFDSENGDKLKGVPIPIDVATLTLGEEGEFLVGLIRKRYYVKVESTVEAQAWIQALKERKHLAIKENMGHSPLTPGVKSLNKKAMTVFNRKLKWEEKEAGDQVSNPMMMTMS
ncbi:hypothetical protein EON65_37155 [archaeon]|nr:MAG: hypothetical protein EON65_37155 [archaeon]